MKAALILFLVSSLVAGCGGGQMSTAAVQESAAPHVVIFIGDSLTYNWDLAGSFPGKHYINRGVAGNTSAEVQARFATDVISSHPDVVVIMAGSNDVDSIPLSETQTNMMAMINSAKASGIVTIVGTIPPKSGQLSIDNPNIVKYNAWLRTLPVTIADYYPVLEDASGQLRAEYALPDPLTPVCCLHINSAGYAAITPIASSRIP